jgi:fructose-1,6-bisphosphatase/sedoheptulose 1,7-bisphosphatase-like protein
MLLLILGEGILRVRVVIEILALENMENMEDIEKNVEKDVKELVVVVMERKDALLNVVL